MTFEERDIQLATLFDLEQQAITAGVVVRSPSSPELNGTYSVHLLDRVDAHRELQHLSLTSSGRWPHKHPYGVDIRKKPPPNQTAFFINGTLTKKVIDTAGVLHRFTVEQYRVFGQALIDYETAVRAAYTTAVLTNSAFVAPSSTIEIEGVRSSST